jgi:hypothetical protein
MSRLIPLVALLLTFAAAAKAADPHPPCGSPAEPTYARSAAPPALGVWQESDLQATNWRPAACLGWTGRSRLVVAIAGEFAAAGGLDELLRRIGGFSHYGEIRYWSTMRRSWQPLVHLAGLLPASASPADAPPERFAVGQSLDYFEVDAAGRSTYRLTVRERSPERVVLAVENTSAIRLSFMPLFEPRALQTMLFLDHHEGTLWRYYQALRATDGTSAFALASTTPYVNRLIAFYGYLSGPQIGPRLDAR